MDVLEDKTEAETMAQLSFCFEPPSYVKFSGSTSCRQIDTEGSRASRDNVQARSVVLAFPQDRSSGVQAQLIQRILQRYRFF